MHAVWSRRTLLAAPALAAPAFAAAAIPAAAAETTHYPMACDPSLVAAVREAAALFRRRTGIAIHALPTGPALMVPQMTHQIQNDIVMSRADIVDAVGAAGFAVPGAPRPRFAVKLVLAIPADAPPTALDAAIAQGIFAITDATPGHDRDDVAILAAMGYAPARLLGGLDSGEVGAMVASGQAGAGLMLLSDVRANPGLRVAHEAATPPIAYLAATTRTPRRPVPEAFLVFLSEGDGAPILAHHGVEHVA